MSFHAFMYWSIHWFVGSFNHSFTQSLSRSFTCLINNSIIWFIHWYISRQQLLRCIVYATDLQNFGCWFLVVTALFETSAGTAGHYWYSIYRHTYVCDYWDACLRKKKHPNVDNWTSLKPPTRFWRGLSQDYHLATFYHQSTIFNTEMVQTLWNLRWYWSITITSWFQPSIPKLLWDHAPMVWIAPSHHGSVSLYCSKGTLRSDHFRHLVGLKKYWLRVKGFLTFISTYHIYIWYNIHI